MNLDKTDIFVYAHWLGMTSPALIGILSAHRGKGRKSFSFEYEPDWLKQDQRFILDPDIALFSGPQYPRVNGNFGVFTDSMPDTWGRTLMKKRALQKARFEGKPYKELYEIDYLLGVADQCRMGALRFKLFPDGPFLDDDRNTPVPLWSSVGELQHIARLVESDEDNAELNKWLLVLLAPGSSLGGARPKANIQDKEGQLWIAKFPSKNDYINKAKWEYLAYLLANQCGIRMSESKIERVSGNHDTFFTRRFDRHGQARICFTSAMTMTGNTEESIRDNPASYLDLALFIQNHSGKIQEDLTELWRRMVFNIAISNTDDHLRNHGFVIDNSAWRLSPAFDLNPSVDRDELSLTIDGYNLTAEFDLAMDVAPYFRLDQQEAGLILQQIKNVVTRWENLAEKIGIPRSERDYMRSAFRVM
jgi:serine/threonine-protein kinase HipA